MSYWLPLLSKTMATQTRNMYNTGLQSVAESKLPLFLLRIEL